MTDLSHLRLDLIGALDVREDGSPGLLHWAHLVPENPAGDYWLFMKPEEPHQIKINFLSFIQALEDEFAKKQEAYNTEFGTKRQSFEKEAAAFQEKLQRGGFLTEQRA
ncbi:MAG: hypothetical protein GX874_06700, partial [Smithella sp.]|nr:hypothetical protein [Smithella sp.]